LSEQSQQLKIIGDDTLSLIIDRLQRDLHPDKVILFGSYAAGNAQPDSDVDLMVIWKTELDEVQRYCLVSRLLRDFRIPFDLIVKTPDEYEGERRIINHIVYFAEKYGKVLYEQ
jgi:predicted nucleotidyltransferase